jgi:type VI secretion system protein ImpA
LRKVILVEARSVGRFTFRDLDIAEERATPAEGTAAPGLSLMKAALREAGSDYAETQVAHLLRVREDLQGITAVFRSQAQGGQTPDIEALDQAVAYAIPFLESGIVRAQAAQPETEVEGAEAGSAGGAGAAGVGGLRTRADVKRILEQVCAFLERTEPSNPAPLLIMRAHRLLDRSFIDIIQDLAPEAFGQIEKIAGPTAAQSSETEAGSA